MTSPGICGPCRGNCSRCLLSSWVLCVKLSEVPSEQEVRGEVPTLRTKSALLDGILAVVLDLPWCLCQNQIISLPVTRKTSFYKMRRIQG